VTAIPKLYSKLQASRELRAMLNIGRPERESDVTRLSDAELIQQLSDQAKELGIGIDLNYRFAEPLCVKSIVTVLNRRRTPAKSLQPKRRTLGRHVSKTVVNGAFSR
jgi:hypothetical protein